MRSTFSSCHLPLRSYLVLLKYDVLMLKWHCIKAPSKGGTIWLKGQGPRSISTKGLPGAQGQIGGDRPIHFRTGNQAVIELFREDALDLDAFDKRRKEPARPFEKALEDLKRDGLL